MRKQRKSKPLTIRRVRAVYVEIIEELKQELSKVRCELANYKSLERLREQEKKLQWGALDRCYDETTKQELALFEASPAYKKYQQWRSTSYHANESKRVNKIKYLLARGPLSTGDWMAP